MRLPVTAAAFLCALVALPASATANTGRPFDFEVAPPGGVTHRLATKPFNLVGMRWRGSVKPEIAIRVRRSERGWSRWEELHARGHASDPLWVGSADAVE